MRVVVGAFALWLTTLIVDGSGQQGFWVEAMGEGRDSYILTLLLVALVFGLVNGTLGRIVRVVSIPLYVLTLGLFGLIVNGILISVVAWLSGLVGFGLRVDNFGWAILGALVLTILSSIMNGLLGTNKRRRSDD